MCAEVYDEVNTEAEIGTMNAVRGVVLFGLGVFAIYEGWRIHAGERAWLAYLLGVAAMALGVWRLMRNPNKPLV